jgi:hypothetical protein
MPISLFCKKNAHWGLGQGRRSFKTIFARSLMKNLVEQAGQVSAEVLSVLLQEPISIKFKENELPHLPLHSHIFSTEVRGDWQARSWLVCVPEQLAYLWEKRHTKEENTNLELQIAFLSELDNILCAHFITAIDKQTNTNALGQPPTHFIWDNVRTLPTYSSCTLISLYNTSGVALDFIWFWETK